MKGKGEGISDVLGFLSGIPLFSKLSDASLSMLAKGCKFKVVEKGDVLFLQSDPSESAYIVCSGKISIILNSPDGREMVINEMRKGDIFGELGILTNKNRSTSAIARSETELLVIPQKVFLRIIDDEPQLTRRMLELTVSRLQNSSERESALVFMDAQARLAHLLLELDQQEEDKGYITISQEELAQRTGLIRQTVAKALGKWRRKGWLITGRGKIVLLDHKAFKEMETQMLV
jgi:CRP/FNR family transcriptional regulator, cyclic AMP receptor protein